MKERFKSILLELKTSLLNPNVKKELKNDEDKEQHEELLKFIEKYYKNIDLFEKEEEHVQKLLLKNAEELLSSTSATYFRNYYTQYLRNTLFLLNNYYKSEIHLKVDNSNKIEKDIKLNNSLESLLEQKELSKKFSENIPSSMVEKQKIESYSKLIEELTKNSNPNALSFLELSKSQDTLNSQTVTELLKNAKDEALRLNKNNDTESYSKLIEELTKNSNSNELNLSKLLKPQDILNSIANNSLSNISNVSEYSNQKNNFTIGDNVPIGDEIVIEEKSKIHKNNIALISSDNPSNENDDCLNTKADINAFAKLIAYKELTPPLAIGLFGKWGSGKSTFMDNLKRKIEKLSKEENSEKNFHEKIAHIEFNAWHYSDSNLWANIMIQIFEKLNEFLVGEMPNKIENLYLELESTQKLLKDKETEKTAIETKITNNKKELTNKQNQKIEKTFKLNQLKDLTKLVFEDEYIKAEINNITKDIPSLKDKSIDEIYIKLNYDFNKNKAIIKKFFSFLKNDKQFQMYLIIGIFIILSILGILKYLDIFKIWLTSLVIIPLGTYFNRFKDVTSKISKFTKFYETVKEKNTKDEVELNLLKEQANLDLELTILEETISLENRRLEKISFEIEHIKSGKYLADFIMEKANSNDYKQHLGLISLIRNDLEKLSKYLDELDSTATHKIDRIVLYIDDLDRCSEDKIMDVLEAIHLLLAFDLFVVIVGVDTRWIKNSLKSKRNLKGGKTATATEYLEKIFQIPFHLNNMEEDVKKEQLKKLMKNDLINTNEKINNKDEDKLKENSVNNPTNTQNDNLSNEKETSQNNSNKKLKIEPFEYEYILKNANFLGDTPRTIKRFMNIYRIIRSHEYILNELLEEFEEQYKFIIMILCLNNKNDNLVVEGCSEKLKELGFDSTDINAFEEFEKKDELFKFISRFSFRDCK